MRNKQNSSFAWVAMVIVVVLAAAECTGALMLINRVANAATTTPWTPAGNLYGR